MPLKGIPSILVPALLKVLAEMGHGDLLVLSDIHFPSTTIAKAAKAVEIRYDSCCIPTLLEAILKVFPLDTYDIPFYLMTFVPGDGERGPNGSRIMPPVWRKYLDIIKTYEPNLRPQHINITNDSAYNGSHSVLHRQDFYKMSKTVHAVIHTGETAKYGNLILRKGLVTDLV